MFNSAQITTKKHNYLRFELYSCINPSDDDPARHWLQHLPTSGRFLNRPPFCIFLPYLAFLYGSSKSKDTYTSYVTCNKIDWLQNYIQGSCSDGYWATYKTWHRSKGLYNFFFQLAASVLVPLPLGAGRAAALRGPLLAVLLMVFLGDLLLAFCHSRLESWSWQPRNIIYK